MTKDNDEDYEKDNNEQNYNITKKNHNNKDEDEKNDSIKDNFVLVQQLIRYIILGGNQFSIFFKERLECGPDKISIAHLQSMNQGYICHNTLKFELDTHLLLYRYLLQTQFIEIHYMEEVIEKY